MEPSSCFCSCSSLAYAAYACFLIMKEARLLKQRLLPLLKQRLLLLLLKPHLRCIRLLPLNEWGNRAWDRHDTPNQQEWDRQDIPNKSNGERSPGWGIIPMCFVLLKNSSIIQILLTSHLGSWLVFVFLLYCLAIFYHRFFFWQYIII